MSSRVAPPLVAGGPADSSAMNAELAYVFSLSNPSLCSFPLREPSTSASRSIVIDCDINDSSSEMLDSFLV